MGKLITYGNVIEMEYSSEEKRITLVHGQYKDVEFYIMNLGTHPTAYINIPSKLCMNNHDLYVHGGITYSEGTLETEHGMIEGNYVGWDYAHYGDYTGFLPSLSGRKYTTQEILNDVKEAIDQLQG